MDTKAFIEEALGHTMSSLVQTMEGVTREDCLWHPTPECNHIGFLLWHMGRVEDNWINRFCRKEAEVWTEDLWYERFGMEAKSGIGFGFDMEAVDKVPIPEPSDLMAYIQAVRSSTLDYLKGLSQDDLDIKPRPDVRDMSIGQVFRQVLVHNNQHLAQIDYIKGLRKVSA